jgi:hypothetical protein
MTQHHLWWSSGVLVFWQNFSSSSSTITVRVHIQSCPQYSLNLHEQLLSLIQSPRLLSASINPSLLCYNKPCPWILKIWTQQNMPIFLMSSSWLDSFTIGRNPYVLLYTLSLQSRMAYLSTKGNRRSHMPRSKTSRRPF